VTAAARRCPGSVEAGVAQSGHLPASGEMPEPLAPALGPAGGLAVPARGQSAVDRRPLAGLIAAYVLFSALIAVVLRAGQSDLDLFFWPSAEIAAHGHPLLVYAVRAGTYPDANGPLSLLPLTGVAALANALGWQGNPELRSALTLAVMAVFPLLLAREAVGMIEASRGPLGRRRLFAYVAFLMAPALFISVASAGHIEQPIELWLTLVAARLVLRGRVLAAGAVLGLVLLTRSAAVVAVVALALVVLADGRALSWLRRVGGAALMVGAAAVVTALGLLPFLLADAHDVVYSLLTFRGAIPIGGGSWWALFARELPWQALVQDDDTVIFVVAAALLVGVALWRRRGTSLTPARLAALLAVAAACVPMLAKTSWGYYALDPYVFAVIWWLGGPGRVLSWRLIPPLLLTGVSLMLSTKQVLPPPPSQVAEGVAASLAMVVAVGLILRDWFASGQPAAVAPSPLTPAIAAPSAHG
jgi:hypothetical protein